MNHYLLHAMCPLFVSSCDSVQTYPVAESPPVRVCISFKFWNLFSGSCVVARSEMMSQITILEIDYTDTTSRISMTTIDL